MLEGQRVRLRPVREADLDELYEAHTAIRTRGSYFPLGVMSESAFRREFAENGFWQKTEGMLLITTPEGEIAGHIEFFRPVVVLGRVRALVPALRRPACRPRLRDRGGAAARRLPVREPRRSTASTWSSCPATPRRGGSRRSAASRWRGRPAGRSSTTAATTTCCCTRCCERIRGRGIRRVTNCWRPHAISTTPRRAPRRRRGAADRRSSPAVGATRRG